MEMLPWWLGQFLILDFFIFIFFIPTQITHNERSTFFDDVPYGRIRRSQINEGNLENKASDSGTAWWEQRELKIVLIACHGETTLHIYDFSNSLCGIQHAARYPSSYVKQLLLLTLTLKLPFSMLFAAL